MSAQQPGNLESRRDELTEAQLTALEGISDKAPNEVLQAAEDIRLIDSDTRDAITTALPNHELLFQKALAATSKSNRDRNKAFKRAFEAVYGRFLLEQGPQFKKGPDNKPVTDAEGNPEIAEGDLEHNKSPLMETFDKVLKLKVDSKFRLKGRSELQAVVRRLRELEAAKGVGKTKETEIAALEAKKTEFEGRLPNLRKKSGDIKAAGELIEKIAHPKNLDSGVKLFNEAKSNVDALDTRNQALDQEKGAVLTQLAEAKVELQPFLERITALKNALVDYKEAMNANGFSLPDKTTLDSVISRLETVSIDSEADSEAWPELHSFLQSKTWSYLLSTIKPVKLAKADAADPAKKSSETTVNSKIERVQQLSKGLKGDLGGLIGRDKFKNLIRRADAIAARKKSNVDAQHQNTAAKAEGTARMVNLCQTLVTELDAVEKHVNTLKTPENEALVPGITAVCDQYLAKLALLKALVPVNLPGAMDGCIKDYKDFVAELERLFEKPKSEATNALSEAQGFLSGFQAEHDRLKSYKSPALRVENILERAFGKEKSGAEMQRLKRLHQDAEHHEHELQEVYKYFADSANIRKVIEASSQVDEVMKEWTKERDEQIKALDIKIQKIQDRILAETDPDKNTKLEAEKATLEKAREKAGLPLNARITYLREQIALKEKATISADQMLKRLNEGSRKPNFDSAKAKAEMEADNERIAEERGALKEELDRLTLLFAKTKEFRTDLGKLIGNAAKAEQAGVDFDIKKSKDGSKQKVTHLVKSLQSINPENKNFNPQSLLDIYADFDGLFDDPHKLDHQLGKFDKAMADRAEATKTAKKDLDKSNAEAEQAKNLTDPQAALKIIGVLVAEQFPELSAVEQQKLAQTALAGDVAKLQTEEGYEALAKRGSAEKLPLETEGNLRALAIRGKLIGFKYQEGDKGVMQPFKGMRPDSFKDWASIEKLFNLGQLNYKNGFFLLAALEIFDKTKGGDRESGVVRSVQSLKVEEKLKMLLAKQLGVNERMHIAGVNKIVNDAFKEQMERVRPLVKAHFDGYDKNAPDANRYHVQALNLEYEELQYKHRTGEIDNEVFDLKVNALLKKAEEADVLNEVNFSQNTMMSKFWNNRYSQWVRDRGINWGKFAGRKVGRWSFGSAKGLGMSMLHGYGKLGLRTGSLGVRAMKYPAALLTGIGSGIFSLCRRGKWLDNVKKDVQKVYGGMIGWQDKMVATSKKLHVFGHVVSRTKAEGAKAKPMDTKKHEERNRVKKKKALRDERIKLFDEKAEIKSAEIADSPFIDLAEYKAKITELDKILGTSTNFPEDKAKADPGHHEHDAHGHEKKAA